MERARTLTNLKVGDRLYLPCGRFDKEHKHQYEVVEIYPRYVRCRDLSYSYLVYESFEIGTLVMAGVEPQWDENFGEDPRRCADNHYMAKKGGKRKNVIREDWEACNVGADS